MKESLNPPTEITAYMVRASFRELAKKYGAIDPALLPDTDPEVSTAYVLLRVWHAQENDKHQSSPADKIEHEFTITTMFVDAGLGDDDYIDEVANDWLADNTLRAAENAGLEDLTARISAKIAELNEKLTDNNNL